MAVALRWYIGGRGAEIQTSGPGAAADGEGKRGQRPHLQLFKSNFDVSLVVRNDGALGLDAR